MQVMPPREIMKYIAFKNGEPISKDGMPAEYKELFEKFKKEFMETKEQKLIKIKRR